MEWLLSQKKRQPWLKGDNHGQITPKLSLNLAEVRNNCEMAPSQHSTISNSVIQTWHSDAQNMYGLCLHGIYSQVGRWTFNSSKNKCKITNCGKSMERITGFCEKINLN